jgi:formate/nitrite transporter FocA (FNT family)
VSNEAGGTEPSRPSAHDIYERVKEDARDELERSNSSLGFSAAFAGFTLGASPLAVAVALSVLGSGGGEELVAKLLFPIGFVAVILGRSQFFTENTLYPVALSLHEREALRPTARLWAVVYSANVAGSAIFALLVIESGGVEAGAVAELSVLGEEAAAGSFGATFWSGVIAGWLLALVAWLVEAAQGAVAHVAVIGLITFLLGLGEFDHCVATTVETFGAVLDGALAVGELGSWLAATTLGNVAGGVLIVSLLNYAQVTLGPEEPK